MNQPGRRNNIIRRDAVRIVGQPAMVDCGSIGADKAAQPIAVVPVLDGDVVVGFEVRCGCGAAAVVECVYENRNPPPVQEPSP